MTPINALIILAILAWCLQIIMGWLQLSRFNRAFDQLALQGRVIIGKNNGRFKPKVVIALAINQHNQIIDGFIMQGYTVFASPKPLTQLYGLYLNELNPAQLFPKNKASQAALLLAIQPKK